MIAIAPENAHRGGNILEFVQIIEHLSAMAGKAGSEAKSARSENRVRSPVAESHCDRVSVELGQLAEPRQRIRHIGLALFDPFQARLRALLGAAILMRKRPRKRTPEPIGRGCDATLLGKLIGD